MGIDVILAEAREESCPDADRESKLRAVIGGAALENTDEDAKVREAAITDLMALLKRRRNAEGLAELLTGSLRPMFAKMAKAKTARIVRAILDGVAACAEPGDADALEMQVQLCQQTVDWCNEEKRTFLRQRVQGRLGALYLQQKKYSDALGVINELLREVKRLDDKAHLLEIQLTEAQIYHALRNLPKSRAALTSARTTANAIYVPPSLQAEIDMMAGIVSADEKDYKTAFSYFFEAFESLNSLSSPRTVLNLKYMLLCKIMSHHAADVPALVSGKIALKYPGAPVESMKAVAVAFEKRSLSDFEAALQEYPEQLKDDLIVHSHLSDLYHSLLEQNLLRLIEPYTCVEITHIAKLIALPLDTVENKLSQMILDKRLNGILDQGNGCLIVFDDEELSKTYDSSLNVLRNMENVVDSLFSKASSLR
ncbi:26S proteasome non-ATPase regulatory subunit 11 [Porphyridium purpureum]|uniref:26S proteasome non-ATPase regulatory subunit 11 n=1 Tax=Porphyridium purpureum TaxID=35688 RepID=A0A5J4YXM1_PORPP|nr:26S proteasome non-ATPase regulatory subunit 11 [Porphyridium purpureum]|eukprot:POR1439..scf208_2